MNRLQISLAAKKLLLLVCLGLFFGIAGANETHQIDLEKDWGIEPVFIRIIADGYMIEFRYKVLDVDKALVLSDRKYYPHLQAEKSQARLSVAYGPTVGVLKSNRRFLQQGRNYTAIFSNEGRHLLPGDKVTVQVKDERTPVMTLH